MKSMVALNTRGIVLILVIAMVVAVPAIATFKSRRATISRNGKPEVSRSLTLSRVAFANPNLPDGLQIPGRRTVKDLRALGYNEDEINQMWQSFQQDPFRVPAGIELTAWVEPVAEPVRSRISVTSNETIPGGTALVGNW